MMQIEEINRLHTDAMDLAEIAIEAKRLGFTDKSTRLLRLALAGERAAATAVVRFFPDSEPTRSVLLRSAASLACECGDRAEAERLIAIARAGNVPGEIEVELQEIEADLKACGQ